MNRDLQIVKFGANYKFESGIPDTVAPTRTGHSAEPSEDEDLAKKSQNPIADLVSVPFQSNTNFNVAPFNRTQEVLNIQPVVPLHINADWNMIARTIIPVISQPNPIFNSGIGDITEELFFRPYTRLASTSDFCDLPPEISLAIVDHMVNPADVDSWAMAESQMRFLVQRWS